MNPTIAVAHYPEGAGHATRMLAIADALASTSDRLAGLGQRLRAVGRSAD